MSDPITRQSPIHHLLEARGADWRIVGGVRFAVRFQSDEAERRAMQSLAVCDLSGLQKFGLKGPDSESRLSKNGIDVPQKIYDSRPLADGGVIVRFASDEFFLESGATNETVPALAARLNSHDGKTFHVERQEATFLLIGSRSLAVLSQTCGINFREAAPRHVVFTRVAGISCAVFPNPVGDIRAYRFWVDCSLAVYLWETLVEICESLNGGVIGAGCLYPQLFP